MVAWTALMEMAPEAATVLEEAGIKLFRRVKDFNVCPF